MFFDIGPTELLALAVVAVIIFGPERLPQFARKAANLVRYVRTMAGNAQSQLKKELGPGFEDVDFRDLNPKAFIKKHLLDDVEPIVADVKADFAVGTEAGKGLAKDLTDTVNSAKSADGSHVNGSGAMAAAVPARVLTPFDPDAT
ncbi:sec-independent translocase [Microlunatus parietis]|uniref:Sec-independent protein translocase protein TatB n=1 Tax=Microlunatus parietis TaxID=682979 RepID=A0A7Y9I4R2_9ACTN|nr:sec-independent translocase [Microlunatus parietis]NYE70248.1 sec-independent protein translocase protein TatB [Microlunatus parietis]